MGLEPTTLGTTLLYSNQLSYIHHLDLISQIGCKYIAFIVFLQIIWKISRNPLYLHTDLRNQVENGGCSSVGQSRGLWFLRSWVRAPSSTPKKQKISQIRKFWLIFLLFTIRHTTRLSYICKQICKQNRMRQNRLQKHCKPLIAKSLC